MSNSEKEFIYKGRKCAIRVNSFGYRCGYVGVDKSSPLYGIPYDKIDNEIDIHGGITCAGKYIGSDDCCLGIDDWCFGIDFAHCFDAPDKSTPDGAEHYSECPYLFEKEGAHVWTLDEAVEETKRLADQLIELERSLTEGRLSIKD